MMQWFVRLSTVALCALLTLPAAWAQPAAAPPAAFDNAMRAAAIHAAATSLRDGYVFPDVGDKAARKLEELLASGSYDSLSEPNAFAARLTADLAAVAHDKHMRVFPPGAPLTPGGPPRPRSEACVVRSDRLPGNIGYIEFVCLPRVGAFRAALAHAMAPLANLKALIIDCRRNRGGDPETEAYLEGYLLPKGAAPVVVDRFVTRVAGTLTFNTIDFSTSPTPFSWAGKPVYVLVSHETFSAGEALAYGLKVRHLARIAGEVTSGGANSGRPVPLGAGFAMLLPSGRSENPVTHTNWEGVGVKPDIEVASADALKAALQQLGQKPADADADIDTLSQAHLFTLRTSPQPGSEAAVHRIIGEHQRGHVDLSLVSDDLAKVISTEELQQLHEMFTKLGAVESVSFDEVNDIGDDVYTVKLANGSIEFEIMLGPDGKTVVDVDVSPLGPPGPPPEK